MKKFAIVAGSALVLLGSVAVVEAQPRHRGGWGHHPYSRGSGWHGGGAVAAGVIGGLVLGGIAAAAASPPSAYPYGYPSYPYGYGYPSYPDRSAYPYPYVRRGYGYPGAGPIYGRPSPYYGGRPAGYAIDPFAAPHEIRGGYRTVYRHGYGRVIVGGPLY